MLKQIFAIVGYTDWGKSNTLYELFERRQFFPLKPPIKVPRFGEQSFVVINASNEDKITKEYLNRLENVLKKHQDEAVIFIITISLIFDNGTHDVKAVFNYLDELRDFEVNYMVLNNSWFTGNSLSDSGMRLMKDCVRIETICRFAEVIDESQAAFSERTLRIASKIKELINN